MMTFRVTMTATALVLALATARADPYVGTDDDGNLQLRSAQGQGVFANDVDLLSIMTSLSARIATLEATGAAQATTNAALVARVATLEATPNPIAPIATPTASPTTSVVCLAMDIESDAQLALSAPYLRTCGRMAGNLNIGFNWRMGLGVSNGTLLAEVFQNLRFVSGGLTIYGNLNLATLDGCFPNLQSVGGNLDIYMNANLASLDGFHNLQSVDGRIYMDDNRQLTTIGTGGFGNLQSQGGPLTWDGIGKSFGRELAVAQGADPNPAASTAGSRAWCASAVGALCPTTTRWSTTGNDDDAFDCCTAYCSTTTDC